MDKCEIRFPIPTSNAIRVLVALVLLSTIDSLVSRTVSPPLL